MMENDGKWLKNGGRMVEEWWKNRGINGIKL
jgi:hypothetical protein